MFCRRGFLFVSLFISFISCSADKSFVIKVVFRWVRASWEIQGAVLEILYLVSFDLK